MKNQHTNLLRNVLLVTLFVAIPATLTGYFDISKAQSKHAAKSPAATTEKAIEANWFTDHKKAIAESQKSEKPLLLLFTGSDWCPPCKALEKNILATAEFKKYADENLVLLKLDFPSKKEQPDAEKKQNGELAKKYKILGYPTVIVLNSKGKKLGNDVGYDGKKKVTEYIEWLKIITGSANSHEHD